MKTENILLGGAALLALLMLSSKGSAGPQSCVTITVHSMEDFLKQKGALLESWQYDPEGECELIAKTWQKEYGGSLVFVAPYRTDTGAWILGRFAGAWLTFKENHYIDYGYQKVFNDKNEVIAFFNEVMKNKFDSPSVGVRIYTYGIDTMPYPIIWNYPM